MRLSIASALTAALLLLSGCDDIVDTVNGQRGPVDVENGTAHTLQRLYHPPCGATPDGDDRIAGEPDLQPGQVLAIDLPGGICRDFKADFSDGQRRVITNVTPDADRRQRITFR